MTDPVEQAAELVKHAASVCVLTGAGVSAESGVPTFREAQTGLWAEYDPQALATPEAFAADPDLVWQWYSWRRQLIATVKPNAGHVALAELETLAREMILVTQNVDGLHQRAGSRNVVEFHGNLNANACFAGHCDVSEADLQVEHPICPQCGARIRPAVVWFGEAIPAAAMESALQAAAACDVFLSIGTSSLVWPAAGLADLARQNGASVIEINPNPTPVGQFADICCQGASGQVLPDLVEKLRI